MTVQSTFRRLALALLAVLFAAGCGRSREEERLLVFHHPDAAPAAVASLRQLAEAEEIAVDTATDPAVFQQDSLARYSAVVFLEASGDTLSHRQQADLERYIQAGGGFVGIGARPARTWPWFNALLGEQGATTPGGAPVRNAADAATAAPEPRREFDGGRVAIIGAPIAQEDAWQEDLRAGIDYAIGRNRRSDFSRARTPRVPEASRFQQEVLVPGPLDEPTELAVAHDGRVFFAQRKGALHLYDPQSGETRQVAQLTVDTEEENGLIGLTLDPGFAQNNWLYLNYSVADSLRYRVSRFTFTGNGIADEKVLLEVPYDPGCCHTGGSMTFDGRGNLFVSYGDNANPFESPYTPIDPSPGKRLWDARRTSANTQDLRGKILRITPQPDGTYRIPEGNLFQDPRQGRREIYTMGHRNPYRISVDRRTGNLYWGEVGPDARVDSVFGPKGYDEVNQARQAGNFGWPLFIANNKRYRDANWTAGTQGELFDPQRPVNDSPNNTGAKVLPPAQPALIYYPYDVSEEFPLVGDGGRNAMAGPVYRYADFEGSQTRLPEYYDGKFIHYDWMRGWLMAATLDEEGNFVKMEPFLEHLEFDHPIDMEMGPDGTLYVLEYGTYWFAANPSARLTRITFHAGNRPPTAQMVASDTVGAAPLTVAFSAEGTTDHDQGDELSYSWSFGGGEAAQGPTVRQTFDRPGTYTARLVVRDASGATSEATRQIRVGNAPPQVSIALQGNRSFYWDGGSLDYRVQVQDPEDGTLGSGIDPQRVRVALEYLPEGIGNAAVMPGHQVNLTPRGQTLIQASDCSACHGVNTASVGPSFQMVADRYAGKKESIPYLVNKIIEGGGGVWGEHRMSAHPNLARTEAEEMVNYILSLSEASGLPPSGTLSLDRHRPGESGAYIITATYADQARHGVGPLRTREAVVLRPPFVRAAEIGDVRFIGTAADTVADGSVRMLATAYADGAHVYLGPTDLTGLGRVRVSLRSLGHPLTLELRAGGPDGRLIASSPAVQAPAGRWTEAAVPLRATGEHDLYLVFRSQAEGLGQWNPLARVDLIRFDRAGR